MFYTQFTCFTSTKVQKYKYCLRSTARRRRTQAPASAEHVYIYSVYLLYWYKSTNSDAASERGAGDTTIMGDVFKVDVAKWHAQVLRLLALRLEVLYE
jgi:hypothetical protein